MGRKPARRLRPFRLRSCPERSHNPLVPGSNPGGPIPTLEPAECEQLPRRLQTYGVSVLECMSPEMVRNHVRHVLRALGVHSRLEAVAMARRERLVA